MKLNNNALALLLIWAQAHATNMFFETGKEGWFYYQEDKSAKPPGKEEQKKKDQAFMQGIPLNHLDSLQAKAFGATFARAKAIAVMHPTKDNVRIVQVMNKWQTHQSEKFARVWMVNMLENPDLEYPTIAKDKFGRSTQFYQKQKETQDFFTKHKENLGYVVFYSKKNKMAYQRQKMVFKALKDKYGMVVKYINTDQQPNMIKKFKLATTPESFFVYKNSKGQALWMRVKSGLSTQEEIIKNTLFLYNNAITKEDK